jgi:hypothetical protein
MSIVMLTAFYFSEGLHLPDDNLTVFFRQACIDLTPI